MGFILLKLWLLKGKFWSKHLAQTLLSKCGTMNATNICSITKVNKKVKKIRKKKVVAGWLERPLQRQTSTKKRNILAKHTEKFKSTQLPPSNKTCWNLADLQKLKKNLPTYNNRNKPTSSYWFFLFCIDRTIFDVQKNKSITDKNFCSNSN